MDGLPISDEGGVENHVATKRELSRGCLFCRVNCSSHGEGDIGDDAVERIVVVERELFKFEGAKLVGEDLMHAFEDSVGLWVLYRCWFRFDTVAL